MREPQASYHAQVFAIIVLTDDVAEAAQCGTCIFIDGDFLIRGGWLPLTYKGTEGG